MILLGKYLGEDFQDVGLGEEFSEFTPKAWSIEGNIAKLGISKLKRFVRKDPCKRVKGIVYDK